MVFISLFFWDTAKQRRADSRLGSVHSKENNISLITTSGKKMCPNKVKHVEGQGSKVQAPEPGGGSATFRDSAGTSSGSRSGPKSASVTVKRREQQAPVRDP